LDDEAGSFASISVTVFTGSSWSGRKPEFNVRKSNAASRWCPPQWPRSMRSRASLSGVRV